MAPRTGRRRTLKPKRKRKLLMRGRRKRRRVMAVVKVLRVPFNKPTNMKVLFKPSVYKIVKR
jgi:hypothetical protein